MRVELGAKVQTADEVDMGSIRYVIVDPESASVKKVVVGKGSLLNDDLEIPLELLEEGPENGLRLSLTEDQTGELSRFFADSYLTPPDEITTPFAIPVGGVLWPAAIPFPTGTVGPVGYSPPIPILLDEQEQDDHNEHDEILKQVNRDNALIDRGSDVYSLDGEKIGEVEEVEFDAVSGRLIRLVVRKGVLFREDVEIPVEEIESVSDGVISLRSDKTKIEQRLLDHRKPRV